MGDFRERVLTTVCDIPKGQVATYGQVAAMAGSPGAARAVGLVLRGLTIDEEEVPWWRVVNSQGYLTINHQMGGVEKQLQKDLLEIDGVEVIDLRVDIARYLYH